MRRSTQVCFLAEHYGYGTNRTERNLLTKRTKYYQVNWISYSYDVWLALNANSEFFGPDIDYQAVEDQLNADYVNVGDPDTYCMCIDGNTSGNYNDDGDAVGVTGEVYFNTYGGIYGYCNTATCGAQCPGESC